MAGWIGMEAVGVGGGAGAGGVVGAGGSVVLFLATSLRGCHILLPLRVQPNRRGRGAPVRGAKKLVCPEWSTGRRG